MHDLWCTDADDMHSSVLAQKVRYMKEDEGGVNCMCESMEKLLDKERAEGREEGRKEGRKEGREEGREEGSVETVCTLVRVGKLSVEDAAETLGISPETILENL